LGQLVVGEILAEVLDLVLPRLHCPAFIEFLAFVDFTPHGVLVLLLLLSDGLTLFWTSR
jgi:hypothetical protein